MGECHFILSLSLQSGVLGFLSPGHGSHVLSKSKFDSSKSAFAKSKFALSKSTFAKSSFARLVCARPYKTGKWCIRFLFRLINLICWTLTISKSSLWYCSSEERRLLPDGSAGNLVVSKTLELKEKKFYPGLGLEPRPLALCASALTTMLSRTSADPW